MLAQEGLSLTADPQEVNSKRKKKLKEVKPSNYWLRTNCSNTTKPNYTQTEHEQEHLLNKTINHQQLINKRILSMNGAIFEWLFTYVISQKSKRQSHQFTWIQGLTLHLQLSLSQILYSQNCIQVKSAICIITYWQHTFTPTVNKNYYLQIKVQ